jgi:hypothetical protein
MASTDAKPIPQKNVAYRVTFPILDADGDLVTGATGLDSEVSKDGGAFADCTNEATEIATNSGMYFLDLTSTEMNADTVAVIVKTSSSGAKTTPIVMYPEEAGDVRVNVTQVNGTNQTAGDLVSKIDTIDDFLDTEIAAIKAKTDNLPSDPADASDIASSFSTVNTKLDTIDDFLDTEVAAIKAKTDNLPSDPADQSALEAVIEAVDNFVDTEVAAIKSVTDKLDTALEQDGAVYRFTENALEEAPSAGGGATAAQIADAVWDERIDDHLSDRSFGMKIGIHLPFVTPDFDYKRIKRIIDESIASQKYPEVDMGPISVALQSIVEEVRAIDIPKAEKPDFTPVMNRVDEAIRTVKAIKIPETDLSPIQSHLDKQDKIIKPQVEEIKDTLEQMLERIRQYFDGDMDAFKKEVSSIKDAFESIPYVVMEVRDKPKPTELKEEKKKDNTSVLDEYLKLK